MIKERLGSMLPRRIKGVLPGPVSRTWEFASEDALQETEMALGTGRVPHERPIAKHGFAYHICSGRGMLRGWRDMWGTANHDAKVRLCCGRHASNVYPSASVIMKHVQAGRESMGTQHDDFFEFGVCQPHPYRKPTEAIGDRAHG